MTAGFNVRFDVWRINWADNDDEVGGAIITGSCVYHGVMARMEGEKPNQLLLQQGLETVPTFTATIIPGTLDIRERDEVLLSEPFDHVYHNQYFRVTGVLYSDLNPRDPRNYLIVYLQRSRRAHANNLNQ